MGFVYDTYEEAFRAWKRKPDRYGWYIEEITDHMGRIEGYTVEPCVDEELVLAEY